MPLLSIDKQGRFYETSPDRSDGSGYKGHGKRVGSLNDVTFGQSFKTHERKYKQAVAQNRRQMAAQDSYDAQMRRAKIIAQVEQARRAQIQNELTKNPLIQRALLKKALGYGCSQKAMACKPDATQKAIRHHVSGLGYDTSARIGDDERSRMQHKAKAEAILKIQARSIESQRLKAMQAAQAQEKAEKMRNAVLAARGKARPISEFGQARRRAALVKPVAPMIMHPMQLMMRVGR